MWNNSYEEDPDYFKKIDEDFISFNFLRNDLNEDIKLYSEEDQIRTSLFNINKEPKSNRKDYYLKNIKVLALSKWLIKEINNHLKLHYKIKQKMQKPSQSFITETNIIKNKSWMNLSIEEILTNNFNEYYPKKEKNSHWEKKKEKNEKIFSFLHKKYQEVYIKDIMFQRTMMEVLRNYIKSEQFFIDKNNKKTNEERSLFDQYANGDSNTPSIIDYFLMTPGNKIKNDSI